MGAREEKVEPGLAATEAHPADVPAAEAEERAALQRRVTVAIGRSGGYVEALTAVLRRLCTAASFVHGEAWLTSREGAILKPGPAWSLRQDSFAAFRAYSRKLGFRRGSDLPGRVLRTGKAEWIEDLSDPGAGYGRRDLAAAAGLRSALAVPVRTPREILAVVVLYAEEVLPEDPRVLERFKATCAGAGPLLERVRIEEELRVRARQQEAVASLGVQALTTPIDELLAAAVDVVVRDLGADCGEVLEVLPRGNALLLRAGVGWDAARVGRMTLPAGLESHAGSVLMTREPLLVEDFSRETRFAVPMYLAERDLASGVSVPIHDRDRPLGVLGVYTTRRRRFSADDVHFLQGVAHVLGSALTRDRAAAALREREARIRAIVETAVDGIVTVDRRGTIESFNPAAEGLFQYRADEVLGENVRLLVPEGAREAHDRGLTDFAKTGKSRLAGGREVEGRRRDGSRFPAFLSVQRLDGGDGVRFVAMVHDMTRQKAVERALEKERAFVTTVLDAAGALVAVLDARGAILRFNRACEKTTGYAGDAVEGRPLWELLPDLTGREGARAAFEDVRDGGQARQCECECRAADGTRRRILWTFTSLPSDRTPGDTPRVAPDSGASDLVVAAGLDVTARRRAEEELERHRQHLERLVEERTRKLEVYHEQLRQADRLASIGTLAAGLGHDMNNVLLPVLCRLDALEKGPLNDAMRAEAQGIRQSLEFLRQLSRGLRLFALDPDDPEGSDETTVLKDWWKQTSPLLSRALPKGVTFEASVPDDLPAARVPAHRLTQAVLNLIVNAGEATGGEGHVRLWAEALEEDAVRLCVSDDGHGMSEEVLRHALEPFFTTKKRNLSTGLGLSLVHGVAKAAGGTVSFDSRPGEGTTVRLDLPAVAAPRGSAVPAPPEGAVGGGARRRTASVSLDDARMAAIVATLLKAAGFDVVRTPPDSAAEGLLWVAPAASLEHVRAFLAADLDRRAVVVGPGVPADSSRPRLTFVESGADLEASSELEALRQALRTTVHDLVETTDVF